jgi:hypothetical protein
VTYDVEIRNISRTAIVLPWSLIPPDASPTSASSSVFFRIGISLRPTDDAEALVGHVEALYGDPADPPTVRRVPPGVGVVIRVSTTCTINYATLERPIDAAGSSLKVAALVSFRRRETESPAFVRSNEIDVTVARIDEPPRP